jgi:hypothetical protein
MSRIEDPFYIPGVVTKETRGLREENILRRQLLELESLRERLREEFERLPKEDTEKAIWKVTQKIRSTTQQIAEMEARRIRETRA